MPPELFLNTSGASSALKFRVPKIHCMRHSCPLAMASPARMAALHCAMDTEGMAMTPCQLAGQLCHLGKKSKELSPGTGSGTAGSPALLQQLVEVEMLSWGHREGAGTVRFTQIFTSPVRSNCLFRPHYVQCVRSRGSNQPREDGLLQLL